MSDQPPISQALCNQVSPAAQAALLAAFGVLEQRIGALEVRLGQDSSNSSKPPSSDPLRLKRRPSPPPSGRKRGGQRGHRRSTRPLVPPEGLADTVECRTTACSACGHGLTGDDPEPWPHQVAEVTKVRPTIVEYRHHCLTCPRCGKANRGGLPAGEPRGTFGHRLQPRVALGAGESVRRRGAQRGGDLPAAGPSPAELLDRLPESPTHRPARPPDIGLICNHQIHTKIQPLTATK